MLESLNIFMKNIESNSIRIKVNWIELSQIESSPLEFQIKSYLINPIQNIPVRSIRIEWFADQFKFGT